jgi:hypothetical protein
LLVADKVYRVMQLLVGLVEVALGAVLMLHLRAVKEAMGDSHLVAVAVAAQVLR